MIVLILLFICFTLLRWLKTKEKILCCEPPMVSGWLPLVGHAHRILGNNVQTVCKYRAWCPLKPTLFVSALVFVIEMLQSILDLTKECEEKGGVVTVYLGFYKLYAIVDPEDSLTIMNTTVHKHLFYDFLKPMFGNGIFTADVPTWKKNRKLLNPAFSYTVLNGYIDIFNAQAERLVEQFSTEVGKSFNHEDLLRVNNLETICSTSLGLFAPESRFGNVIKEYILRLTKILSIFNNRLQKFWLYSDFVYNLTNNKKKQDAELKKLTALSKVILQKNKNDRQFFGKTFETNKVRPFIELILDLADETGSFSLEQIEKEIDNIIFGGHDTSATILTFALAELGSNMAAQGKAVEEIYRVLGNTDKRIDKEDLSKLEYIEAIIKETLRLHVVVPLLPRLLDRDVQLKNYKIKANSSCFILIHGINRHKGLWGADADQFRPERWLEKDSLPDAKYFAAFGMGKRSCIGKTYATMSMKISLTHLLRAYHVTSDIRNVVKKISMIVRPESGHHITLTKRKWPNNVC